MKLAVSTVELSASDLLVNTASTRAVFDVMLNLPHGALAYNALDEVHTSIAFSQVNLPKREANVSRAHCFCCVSCLNVAN